MGSREQNFYNALAVRMGYAKEATQIQDRYLARDYDAAAAAVPFAFLDRTSLVGPVGRIADGLRAYADAGVTTLSVVPYAPTLDRRLATLRTVVDAAERAGVAP